MEADAAPGGGPPPAATPEPDPRVERSRRLILSAALDLLGEVGYGGLTIEGVAARAGVAKSTIYRHWDGKLELIEDAIRTLKATVSLPAGGSARDRVTALLQQVATSMASSTWSACLPAIIDAAERDPQVLTIHRRFSCERRQMLVDLLTEGVASGEIAPGLDLGLLAECLIGPIVVRRLLLHEPFDPAGVLPLVSQVLPPPATPRGA
ncbi:MAG: TetR family transcriptional regulator [Actinobacteria bacterium]|nr:MAG: TetR family transcriptional regulator [Actinomycetota bacterium]